MADDNGSAQSKTIWPLPAFHFFVKIGSITDPLEGSFQEVSGLSSETQVIEYRHSTSKDWWAIKMPGIRKLSNVTLKRGIFVGDNAFWTWYSASKQNIIKREDITIQLLDEESKPQMVWTLGKAFPVKITAPDLKADGNEVAVHTVELAYETMVISPS